MKRLPSALPALLLGLSLGLFTATARAEAVAIDGSTLDGAPLHSAALRGQVLLIVFWRTDCAPCIQRLQELRETAAGWRQQAFRLVLINQDRDRAAAQAYWATLQKTRSAAANVSSAWAGDVQLRGVELPQTQLPPSLLVDGQGNLQKTYPGRITPQAWDEIAELVLNRP